MLFTSNVTKIQSQICKRPAVPVLQSPANGLKVEGPETVVSGLMDPDSSAEIEVNMTQVYYVTADANGEFETLIGLSAGQNLIIARTVNACGDKADSKVALVTYVQPEMPGGNPVIPLLGLGSGLTDIITPVPVGMAQHSQSAVSNGLKLQVFMPPHSTTDGVSALISGLTLPSAQITITDNSRQVADLFATPSGYFSVLIPLQDGRNDLVVQTINSTASTQIPLSIFRESTVTASAPRHIQPRLPAWLLVVSVLMGSACVGMLWNKKV